jgi:hypothetical protein
MLQKGTIERLTGGNQKGQATPQERETKEERYGGSDDELTAHLALFLTDEYQLCGETFNAHRLAARVVSHMHRFDARRRVRALLIAMAEGKPTCWICTRPIYLDDQATRFQGKPTGPYLAHLTLDHVRRLADGGRTTVENCKLAHSLCNCIRPQLQSGHLSSKGKARYAVLTEYLDRRERDAKEAEVVSRLEIESPKFNLVGPSLKTQHSYRSSGLEQQHVSSMGT